MLARVGWNVEKTACGIHPRLMDGFDHEHPGEDAEVTRPPEVEP